MVYQYKWEGFNPSVPAEIVGKRCEAIEAEQGAVTKETLLDDARPEESPIHDLFEWDDAIAGEKYRLHQAVNVLCALKVTVLKEDEEEVNVKAFVNVSEEPGATYININNALKQPDKMEIVLNNALRELDIFRRKYAMLKQLRPVFDAINEVIGENA